MSASLQRVNTRRYDDPAPAAAAALDFSTLQIGTIVGRAALGGGERYFFDLLRALPVAGVRARGLIVGNPAAVADPVAGVESFAADGVARFARWHGLRRSIARHLKTSDVVVSHLAPHIFPALDLIRSHPFVVHFHHPIALAQWREKGLRARREWLEEFLVYRRPSRLIVLSHAFASVLERDYRVPRERIRVIPGGVDVQRFTVGDSRAQARRELGLPDDRPIAVSVRRLVRDKGLEALIDAADILRRIVPDALIAIGGSGPLRATLEARVRARGLERWVWFLGQIPEERLPAVYRAADVSVVPTAAWEGFGLVAIEALASGTPALVTPVGGLPEAVRGLDPALVIEGCDAGSIARALADALTGRRPLPSRARCAAYARTFAWDTVAARIGDVYREAVHA